MRTKLTVVQLEVSSPKVDAGGFWGIPGLEPGIYCVHSDPSGWSHSAAPDSEFIVENTFNTQFWSQNVEPSEEAEQSQKYRKMQGA